MFKFLKRIFSPTSAPPTKRPVVPTAQPVAAPSSKITRIGDAAPGVEVASLSLRAILDKLPADLKATINTMPDPAIKVVLPVNAIMKQLPTGAVKMSLGSLHRQAPAGTFRKTNMEEKRMVDVPLGEVFKSINPNRLQRRHDQKHYVVPEEITGLSGENGTGRSVTSVSAPRSEVVPPPAAAPASTLARFRSRCRAPRGIANGHPAAKPAAPKPSAAPAAAAPAAAKFSAPKAKPAPETPAAPLKLDGELTLSLVELAASWQEGIRSELSVLPGDTTLVLPVAEVSTGLQKGKVQFTWAQIRSWLQPQPQLADQSAG